MIFCLAVGTQNIYINISAEYRISLLTKLPSLKHRKQVPDTGFSNNNMGNIFLLCKIHNCFYPIIICDNPEFNSKLFGKVYVSVKLFTFFVGKLDAVFQHKGPEYLPPSNRKDFLPSATTGLTVVCNQWQPKDAILISRDLGSVFAACNHAIACQPGLQQSAKPFRARL